MEDGTLWDEQRVEHGSAAEKPATNPTKPSTIDKVFTFAGWSGSFSNILADTTVTAVFSETPRTYTVRFFSGNKVVQTSIVECYGSCGYTGEDLVRAGYLWTGWDTQTKNITRDMDVNAVFEVPALPTSVADMSRFTYLFSDDPADSSAYTIGEIYAICAAGLGSTYMSVGDKIKITPVEGSTVKDDYIIMQVYGFNHFKVEDGSEFANVVFGMLGVLNAMRQMNAQNTNVGGWPATAMRKWLNETMIRNLPTVWRNVIKPVQVLSSVGDTKAEIVTSIDKLFLFSYAEVGFETNSVPYTNEVNAGAERKTFALFTDNNSRIKKTYNGTGFFRI